jgi:hypothetical protein
MDLEWIRYLEMSSTAVTHIFLLTWNSGFYYVRTAFRVVFMCESNHEQHRNTKCTDNNTDDKEGKSAFHEEYNRTGSVRLT